MNAYVWPDEDYTDYADDGDWYAPAPAWRPEPPQWPRELMREFERARDLWGTLAHKLREIIADPSYDFMGDPQGWLARICRVGWPAVTLANQVYAMTRTVMILSGERIPCDPYEATRLEGSFRDAIAAWNGAIWLQYAQRVRAARAEAAVPADNVAMVPAVVEARRLTAPAAVGTSARQPRRARR